MHQLLAEDRKRDRCHGTSGHEQYKRRAIGVSAALCAFPLGNGQGRNQSSTGAAGDQRTQKVWDEYSNGEGIHLG